ncbi:MAG: PLD nuclease N-terminal domain-containing protein [Bacteroidota bacterium]
MQLLGVPGMWQILVILIILFALLLPVIALIDILRSEFTGSNKIVWVVVVICLPMLGTLLYFMIGVHQKIK